MPFSGIPRVALPYLTTCCAAGKSWIAKRNARAATQRAAVTTAELCCRAAVVQVLRQAQSVRFSGRRWFRLGSIQTMHRNCLLTKSSPNSSKRFDHSGKG
jgi:hypothetical protein